MLRNEIKYVISEAQATILSTRIRGLLALDMNMTNPEGYLVSSLYFDDVYESSYFEKLAGSEHRTKYRVRTYNGSDSFIALECKEKIGGKIQKQSVRITRSILDGLIRGDFDALAAIDMPPARDMLALNRVKRLYPKVVVTYLREAYIHPLSTTRITFDKRLQAGWSSTILTGGGTEAYTISNDNAYAFPISGYNATGSVILEIKFDEYLPKFISQALSHSGPPLAASKYVLCRDKLGQLNKFYAI